jgi:hypothetical protein
MLLTVFLKGSPRLAHGRHREFHLLGTVSDQFRRSGVDGADELTVCPT